MLRSSLHCAVNLMCVMCVIQPVAVGQLVPTPDPIGQGGQGNSGAECGCTIKLVDAGTMSVVTPLLLISEVLREVTPKYRATTPPEDEWSGNDELYRVAQTVEEKLTSDSGVFSVTAFQGFEIYDGLPGADPGFPSIHEHPSASTQGQFEFKTNSELLNQKIGIILDGNLTATVNASIHGSVVPGLAGLGFHADSGAGASISLEAGNPFLNCPGAEPKLKEQITINGGVNTEATTGGSVSITIGTATKTWKKEKEKETTTNDNVTLGFMHSVTLTDTAYNGNATLASTLNISGSTNSTVVRIPVAMIAAVSGSGTADDGYSIGNGTAHANVVWSGSAMACAMPDPGSPEEEPLPPMPPLASMP